MPFRCINDKFHYCSGTPKGIPTEANAATGEQVPGFEFEANTCSMTPKTCKQFRLWSVLCPAKVAPVAVTEAEKKIAQEAAMEHMV